MTEYTHHPKGPNGKPFDRTQMPQASDPFYVSDSNPQDFSAEELIKNVYQQGKIIESEKYSQIQLNEPFDNGQYPLEMMVRACCDKEIFYKNKYIHLLCMDTLLSLLKHKADPQLSNIDLTLCVNDQELTDKGSLLAGACGGFKTTLSTSLLVALLENGANKDVNTPTQRLKLTPPMIAIDNFNHHDNPQLLNDILIHLLNPDYKMDQQDVNGRNLVMHFIDKIIKNPQKEYNNILKTLLLYKPDLTQTDKFGKTVFDMLENQDSSILQQTKKILTDYQKSSVIPSLTKGRSQGRE